MRSDHLSGGLAASAWTASRWLPIGGLLLALATVFLFVGERDHLYDHVIHDGLTASNMTLAKNLSAQRPFQFHNMRRRADGTVRYELYNRFPIGTVVLIKLAIAPFDGDFSAQLVAARVLMLVFFCAAAVLAYLALARLVGSRAVALAATLLAFSSYAPLHYSDAATSEISVDLFAVMLVFHGMVLFRGGGGERRFWQLACRVAIALLLGWHVYGLLLPFLVLGAAEDATAAWRGKRDEDVRVRLRAVAARVLRGRSALLGALALVFGVGVLGYNFAHEHAAVGGQRAVADLPSARSMLRRTGVREGNYRGAEELAWPTLLKWQFHRVGTMCVPFALAGDIEWREDAWREAEAMHFVWVGVIATVACFVALALFSPPRAPPIALALAGFCWAFLVPGYVAWSNHAFEAVFHIGIPLCLFAALLVGARRLWRRRVIVVCAVASVALFAASGVSMGLLRVHDNAAQTRRARMAEFDAIARIVRGSTVWVAAHPLAFGRVASTNSSMVQFFVAGSFVHYADTLDAADRKALSALDFVLAFERHNIPALLTPSHRFVFLYEAGANVGTVLDAMRAARRRQYSDFQALAPVARSGFDIHVLPSGTRAVDELVYLKAPCRLADTKGRFFLHVLPAGSLPWPAGRAFARRDFVFNGHGAMVDDKCMLRVPLPKWPVANVVTGQWHPAGDAASWRTAFRLDVDRLRAALQAARAEAPTARAEFDLYVPRQLRAGVLRYVREPCAPQDVRRRFFLHVVPDARSVLPGARRPSGFDSLDFEFGEQGALLDGACVAMLALPDYDIARLRTGQFDADAGVVWQVELAANATAAGR